MGTKKHHDDLETGEAPGGDELSIEFNEQEMIDALQMDLNRAQESLNEAQERWKRAVADLENFRRRATQAEQEAKRQGITSVLHSIVPVLDNFDLALTVEPETESARQMLEGVKAIRTMLLQALETHGIGLIAPQLGDEFDPNCHEAMLKQPAEGVEPGCISMVMQTGYKLGERVIRPAKVAVAPGNED